MNTGIREPDLNIRKPGWLTWRCIAAVVFFWAAVLTLVTFPPDYLLRSAVKFVDPAFFDPPYGKFVEIKEGMRVDEVHHLLGSPTPQIANQFVNVGAKSGRPNLVERWEGSRGTIVVSYRERDFWDPVWIVARKEIVQAPK
jgi:hypothetical protein